MKNNNKHLIKLKKGKQAHLLNLAVEKAGSQRKLSKIVNIPKGSISSYIAETCIIPSERLNLILDYLNLKNDDINGMIAQKLEPNWGQVLGGKTIQQAFSSREKKERMNFVRSFIKRETPTFQIPLNAKMCEFFGILMGDGCISRYVDASNNKRCDIVITGDKRYETDYYKYIKELLQTFRVNCYIYKSKSNNNLRLVIRNKSFANYLLGLEFPVGNKYENLKIPEFFLKCPWDDLKFLIRGLTDTDGTIFAKKTENYRYPHIAISSKSALLIQQLHDLLRKQKYPVYINQKNLVLKGIKNVNRWIQDIGLSNPKHTFKYKYWQKNGYLPARLNIRAGNSIWTEMGD